MQLNYKPGIEIAEEEAINTILEDNHFIDIKKRVDYDLTVLGLGVVKHEFLPGNGVTVSYVDPANVVYSYTEDPYFKDCFYWGEIKTVPLTELIKIDPSLTTEDLKKFHYIVKRGMIILMLLNITRIVFFIEIQLPYCIFLIRQLKSLFIKRKTLEVTRLVLLKKTTRLILLKR